MSLQVCLRKGLIVILKLFKLSFFASYRWLIEL